MQNSRSWNTASAFNTEREESDASHLRGLLEFTTIGDSFEVLVVKKLIGFPNMTKDKPCFFFLVVKWAM
jgi:hypothetical protein